MDAPRWVGGVGLAAAVAVSYYLAAYVSLSGLFFHQSEGVTVFWAAAGIRCSITARL
jgi:hypothetical protein